MVTIGQAATRTGLTSDTIRYYERLRLIAHPRRSEGGYRLYDERTVERLRLIRRARSIGLSLEEIGVIFAHRAGADCAQVRDLLTQKIEQIDATIASMTSFRDALSHYRADCDRSLQMVTAHHCPLFSEGED